MNGQSQQTGEQLLFKEAGEIQDAVKAVSSSNVPRIATLLKQVLSDPNASSDTPTHRQLDSLDADTMAAFTNFVQRVNKLKAKPGSGKKENSEQIRLTEKVVRDAMTAYMQLKQDHRKECEKQIERNMRNVKKDVTQEEIQQAIDSGAQVYAEQVCWFST